MATMVERTPRRAGWRTTTAGELVAECLGTFVLICFGDGVVAMAVAALNQSGRGTQIFAASGDWLIIGWGWGLAVAFAVYVAVGRQRRPRAAARSPDRAGPGAASASRHSTMPSSVTHRPRQTRPPGS